MWFVNIDRWILKLAYLAFQNPADQINQKTTGSSSSLTGTGANKQVLDSDSDLDDFNYVLNETERQLYKARQSLEKKKRQQPFASNDRNLRKYDEVLRTCETNIQCLQQILKNLHRSKNSRLNSAKAIEQLQTYLSSWHDMQQQVNDDRIRARQLLYISQEIIKLKLRLDEELSHFTSLHNQNHPWLDDTSISEIKHRVNYELESDREYRQKLASFRADIYQAEQHLQEYRMSSIDSPSSSSSNIDEHLHSCRLTLEQLTDTMDTYQTQLRQLSTIIDNLLPIETQIEQKLTAYDYNQIDLPDVQRLVDKYEQLMHNLNRSMIPINSLHLKLKSHCECKLDLYRKMLNELFRKSQSKHVSFDGSSNYNNNNSSSTYQHHFQDNIREKKYRKTETYTSTSDDYIPDYYGANNKQSSTSSYISDDCKVLYIETVIEVAKPVFYERTSDTLTTTNSEYHHHQQQQQQQQQSQPISSHSFVSHEYHPLQHSSSNTHRSTMNNSFYENRKQIVESSDDDSSKPVNLTASTSSKSQIDSGIEYDQTSQPTLSSSNSTIYNKVLLPPRSCNIIFDETRSETKLIRRSPPTKSFSTVKKEQPVGLTSSTTTTTTQSYRSRLRDTWLRSLLLGLLLLLLLFFVYFSRLDTCSRSILVRTVFRKIICIEDEGLPTI